MFHKDTQGEHLRKGDAMEEEKHTNPKELEQHGAGRRSPEILVPRRLREEDGKSRANLDNSEI